jgi:hypothetical protein
MALLTCVIASIAAVGLFIWTLVAMDSLLLQISIAVLVFAVLSGVTHLVTAFRVRCPLCHGKPLVSQKCTRHRNARTSLGSYRLAVVKGVLLRGRYRCPYCGEPCECATRER